MWWIEALLMANEPKKMCLRPKALFFLSSHGTHLETYSYYENIPMFPKIPYIDLAWLFKDYIINLGPEKIQIGPKKLMFFSIHYAQNL